MTARGLLWLLGLWLCAAGVARAHTFVPTVISLHEVAPGRFVLDHVPPPGVTLAESARLRFPGHCQLQLEPSPQADRVSGVLDCGSLGLRGQSLTLGDSSKGEALVSIQFLGGESLSALIHKDPLHVPVPTVAKQSTVRETLRRFVRLGTSHILAGIDHLLLLAGLLLLTRSTQGLLWTVSAFTVGHSVTLVLATLGWVSPPSQLVEALIALSVVCLAREVVRFAQASSAPQRWLRHPALMAVLFGLLHGLGFASALREVGLPAGQLPLSLVSFNLGVELGQLGFVLALLYPVRWLHRARLVPVMGYLLGSTAAAWTLERAVHLFGSL
jgi:hypothetical protein